MMHNESAIDSIGLCQNDSKAHHWQGTHIQRQDEILQESKVQKELVTN